MTQYIQTEEPLRASQPKQQEQPEAPVSDEDQDREEDEEGDDKLDEAIEMTFPASDPVSI